MDEYYIYVWKKNTPKESAVKIPVPVKTAVDHTIEVEGKSSKPAFSVVALLLPTVSGQTSTAKERQLS